MALTCVNSLDSWESIYVNFKRVRLIKIMKDVTVIPGMSETLK